MHKLKWVVTKQTFLISSVESLKGISIVEIHVTKPVYAVEN